MGQVNAGTECAPHGGRQVDHACAARYWREREVALQDLLGVILNHGMDAGLLSVSADFNLLAREVFFRDLRHRRSLLPVAANARPLGRHIRERWPGSDSRVCRPLIDDPNWVDRLSHTFWRAVHFWLERPMRKKDFRQVCSRDGMDLSPADLRWLVASGVIPRATNEAGRKFFSVRQVFALSAIWYDWLTVGRTNTGQLGEQFAAAFNAVPDLLAFAGPKAERTNASGWAQLAYARRAEHARLVAQPARRLWVEGLANLAGALLFAIGVRPAAQVGRPRLAPDDAVLLTLEELALGYYRAHGELRGCAAWIRRETLNEAWECGVPATRWPSVVHFFRSHAPSMTVPVPDAPAFYEAWRVQFGGKLAVERAVADIRATLRVAHVGDARRQPVTIEQELPLRSAPRYAWPTTPDSLESAVRPFAPALADGPSWEVACWDSRRWVWWWVPRLIIEHQFLRGSTFCQAADNPVPATDRDAEGTMHSTEPQSGMVSGGLVLKGEDGGHPAVCLGCH